MPRYLASALVLVFYLESVVSRGTSLAQGYRRQEDGRPCDSGTSSAGTTTRNRPRKLPAVPNLCWCLVLRLRGYLCWCCTCLKAGICTCYRGYQYPHPVFYECRHILPSADRLGFEPCHRKEHADNTVHRNLCCAHMVSISAGGVCLKVLTLLLGCWVELGTSCGNLSTTSLASLVSKSRMLPKYLSLESSIMQSHFTGHTQDRRSLWSNT